MLTTRLRNISAERIISLISHTLSTFIVAYNRLPSATYLPDLWNQWSYWLTSSLYYSHQILIAIYRDIRLSTIIRKIVISLQSKWAKEQHPIHLLTFYLAPNMKSDMAIFSSDRMEPIHWNSYCASTSSMFELHRQSFMKWYGIFFPRSNYIVVFYMAVGLLPHAHNCILLLLLLLLLLMNTPVQVQRRHTQIE